MPTEWTDVANVVAAHVDTTPYAGAGVVHSELWSRDAGVTLKARLWCVTTSASCGESADVTSTSPTPVTFAVALPSGPNVYRLQVGSTSTGKDLFAIGAGLYQN